MTPEAGLFQAFVDRVRGGEPAAVATVIAVAPADARSSDIGTKLLLDRDGTTIGTLGSADLDRTVAERALDLLALGRSEIVEIEGRRIFVEVRVPPPRLVIVGAVHIAAALSRFAKELGFRVVVSDARDRFATPERFPEVDELVLGWPNEVLPKLDLDEFSYVVVITHDAKLDNPALLAALRSPAPYIGALGSTRTHARRVKALREAGATEEELARIHAPIGLDIGARTPEEIALATIAEIVAVRNARVGGADPTAAVDTRSPRSGGARP